jgi:ABC-type lipoprotein export system ATPase subunit
VTTPETTLVEAHDLTFRYRRNSTAGLAGFNAQFLRGSVTAITGSSGSGKSTLLYLLALLVTPSAGHVLWNGSRADSLPDGARSALRAQHAGFVFQDAMLDPSKTVLANVCEQGIFSGMDPATAGRRARDLLERFGVAHRVEHRPGEVSGGQAQRVALCRALLLDPDVVFADEPTGNLDTVASSVVFAALEERARAGACVIIATHDPTLALKADVCLAL